MHPTRIFKKPSELEKAFEQYKESLNEEAKQWLKIQYVGKDGERVTDPQKLPYTLEGFKRYCRKHYGDVNEYFLNREGLYNDFTTICHAIKEEIRENQITGGLLGFYNPSITQRLNGLVDQKQVEIKEQPLFGDEK
jgi:hypothetical protein